MGTVVRFADIVIDLDRFEIRRGDVVVHVEPQTFDLIAYLVRHRERMVTKAELLDAVWGSRFVTESALSTRIRSARAALGDDGRTQSAIRTVHGRGFRFVGEVDEPPSDTRPTLRADQVIRVCRAADGTRIAWAATGEGEPLVKAAHWMTHLDHDWTTPVWRHWLDGLAAHRLLVRYDERGCGLSDWDTPSFSFDEWVADLALVVDAAGLERFPLLGVSQGAAVAVAYAAQHPERVSRLVLLGGYARGRLVRAVTEDQGREAALDVEVARVGWGRDEATFRRVFTATFLPDATPGEWDDFDEVQRLSTSPANAVRFLQTFARIDVAGLAPLVRCPTLVMHSRGDLRVPAANARELAGLMPDSRLVLLDSRNHLLTAHEPAWAAFLAELDAFLAEGTGGRP